MFMPVFVCLSVSKITQKARIWMKYVVCRQMSGHGQTD